MGGLFNKSPSAETQPVIPPWLESAVKPMMQDSINLFRDFQRGGANIFMPTDQRQYYTGTGGTGGPGGGGGGSIQPNLRELYGDQLPPI